MARHKGQPRGSKLDAHGDFLLGLIVADPAITLKDMQDRLAGERAVTADGRAEGIEIDAPCVRFLVTGREERAELGLRFGIDHGGGESIRKAVRDDRTDGGLRPADASLVHQDDIAMRRERVGRLIGA